MTKFDSRKFQPTFPKLAHALTEIAERYGDKSWTRGGTVGRWALLSKDPSLQDCPPMFVRATTWKHLIPSHCTDDRFDCAETITFATAHEASQFAAKLDTDISHVPVFLSRNLTLGWQYSCVEQLDTKTSC